MTTMKYIWAFAILAASWIQATEATEVDTDPEKPSYLQNIIATYGSYSSYQDKGKIEIVYYEKGKKVDEKHKLFSTKYIKDGLFEIKWKKVLNGRDGIEYRIWKSEGGVHSKYGIDEEFQSTSLMDALSRAAGISTSLTTYVPCLLYEEMGCFLCDKKGGYAATPPKQEKGNLLRLEIVDSSGNKESIWVDNKTNVVKKIEWWNERGDLRIHHRITYSEVQGSK